MVKEIEMFVRLIIPDTTAITAFHTLERMGYKELKKLLREDYYKFYISDDYDVEKFKEKISKVDILVNANKHRPFFTFSDTNTDEEHTTIKILVKDIGECSQLLSTLKNRLGFENIERMEKGTLWVLSFNLKNNKVAEGIAKDIAQKLLYNKHYQEMELL
jgi:phosphoribosylformylglycinamidine (FGAM) synthase PurS component